MASVRFLALALGVVITVFAGLALYGGARVRYRRRHSRVLWRGRAPRLALAIATAALIGGVVTPASPASAAGTPPPVTFSRYISTTNLYTMGCNQGESSTTLAGSSRLYQMVILDFGIEVEDSNGVYGALPWGGVGFQSIASLESEVEGYMQGFWNCSGPNPFLYVAAGTNNYANGCGGGGYSCAITSTGGYEWAVLAYGVNAWISGEGYTSQLHAQGASDMEPSWDGPTPTTAWANGFASFSPAETYYNFGSADGCPPYGSCNNGWSQSSIYNVTWGLLPAYASPEIYTWNGSVDSQAQEWSGISAGRIGWSNALSQYQACADTGNPCSGVDNTPAKSWTDLGQYSGDYPTYSTEMSWRTT